jgi:feruloyl esterase
MQTGNGGAAGSIVYASLADGVARGYAVANTDTGHRGAVGDFSWAAGHPEKITDFAYRAVHELTIVGKAVTSARYGQAPERSYWNGCSTGGRQGLKEAQRFPDDYDAIVAGAPASNWSALMSFSIVAQSNMTGPSGLGVDKVGVLKEAAIAACDAHDGVVDRVIAAPAVCTFDPASTQCAAGSTASCLSPTEVAAAKRIYAGLVNDAGRVLFPGTGPGSEPLWAAYASPGFAIGTNYFRNVVAGDQSFDPASFDVDADLVRAEGEDGGAARAMDPDLSAFVDRGGKLLVYHGTTDGLIPYENSVNYHESVVATLGSEKAEDSVGLYLVPGMDHCSGGEGAFAVDWVAALEQWDETGKKPSSLAASHPAMASGPPGTPPSKPFTRPVCAYPLVAKYTGEGDNMDAANWQCVAP